MKFEYFIAKRIITSKPNRDSGDKGSISGPIIKIAITAIAIGMVMMLAAIATGIGLQRKIKEKVSAFNGDIVISNFDTNYSNDSQKPISLSESGVYDAPFSQLDGIRHVQATALKSGIIRTATDFEGVVVKGVGSDYDWQFFEEFLVDGRLPDHTNEQSLEILLSEHLVNRLQLQLGDKVVTYFMNEDPEKPPRSRPFDLVGIYNSGFQQFDESYLIAGLWHIRHLNRWDNDQVGSIEVFVSDFRRINTVAEQVYYTLPSKLDSRSLRESHANIFEWLDLFDFNIALIIGIMILVAGINMITALLVLILERTHMIGILKSLGSSNSSIRKIFLYNAMYLIGIGLFWGNLIGLGLLWVQKQFGLFPLNPETYYVTEAPVYLNFWHILLLNIGVFILCLAMLLIPSYVVSKIAPIKAIRFE